MRGRFRDQGKLFSYLSPESRVPAEHPLRRVRQLVRDVLTELSPNFGQLYARDGRPSIAPEQLLGALLLQVFYGIRSERQLMEQLDYNLLYRWFVIGLPTSQAREKLTGREPSRLSGAADIVRRCAGYQTQRQVAHRHHAPRRTRAIAQHGLSLGTCGDPA